MRSKHTLGMLAVAVVLAILPGLAPIHSGATAGTMRNLERTNVTFYVDPQSNPSRQAEEWAESRPEDAAVMERLAQQPHAFWFGDWAPDPRADLDEFVTRVTATGALPLLTIFTIPYRDCGHYSAGGSEDGDAYRAWIAEAAAGIGDRSAVVILEPDALAAIDCLTAEQQNERYDLLAHAIDTFEAQPGTDVYLDAGNADWHPPALIAARLQRAGVNRASGFALNVSNFHTTEVTTAYGREVSAALGTENGTPFVIDTSRNGNGVWEDGDAEPWCNPPGRALGTPSTTETDDPLVDAYLWIKIPGESDGECRGAPPAGEWMAEYALELARNAGW